MRESRGSPVGRRRRKRDRERNQRGGILGVECSAVLLVRQGLMGFCNHEVCLRLTSPLKLYFVIEKKKLVIFDL